MKRALPYLLSGAVVLALWFALGWYGDRREDVGYGRRDLEARAEVAAAQADARAEERRRVAAIEEIRNEADQELAAVVERERRAADVRVRDAVAEYARRHRPASNSGAAQSGAPVGDPIGMFAELLGELDDLAGQYAAAADRARAAGLTCERAYDSLR
ncbi:DUF2514 family protein [Orrella dioscoreae]|uniref:Homology to phage-tail assembly proteins n=1 Tax=Orrella dioscoreae TaxID=1851544 RepID=A0A1C3K7L9_9BURK|nr:DUF2514 family protein [Orrella dioscoreae]SBT27531.1 Homology to phage-tail assembly proteins [Orrella dioscoreae]SOE48126.1 Homology to phage-tail assembly proteins [Orrella dioscoreae]